MHSRRRRPARPGCGTSKHTQVEPRAAIPGVDRHPHARRTLSHRPLHAVADEQVIPADPCRGGALELQSLSFLKIRTMLLLSISGDDDSDERGWRARLACIPARRGTAVDHRNPGRPCCTGRIPPQQAEHSSSDRNVPHADDRAGYATCCLSQSHRGCI